jgi:hypothetical protein
MAIITSATKFVVRLLLNIHSPSKNQYYDQSP